MLHWLYPPIKNILFQFDAEKIHDLTIKYLSKTQNTPFSCLYSYPLVSDPIECFGLKFPNRIGLAAGLDKNADCIDAFSAMGFGHIEVGTVTPRPQKGNEKPRLFRLSKAQALINRFGFNNKGVDYLIHNIQSARYKGILGINIGKNWDTPMEKAIDDYLYGLDKVYPYASYVVLNISSPNTHNLRQLQSGQALNDLLHAIKEKQEKLSKTYHKKPILIKIAPDLNEEALKYLASTFVDYQVDGVILSNTTFSRTGVESIPEAKEVGGLSGAPLFDSSTLLLKKFSKQIKNAFPIIGLGGIDSPSKAQEKLNAGASLVQLYTGLIYKGPHLIHTIASALKGYH
jgi:dihydroorotate dehydrogenase